MRIDIVKGGKMEKDGLGFTDAVDIPDERIKYFKIIILRFLQIAYCVLRQRMAQ